MLPREEIVAIDEAVADAFLCAEDGFVPRAFLLLREGLRAERESSRQWRDEAAARWLQALALFRERFPRDWYPPDD